MTNDTYSGNRHMYVGIEHIWTHLIGFHGNIPRWGTSQLGKSISSISLISSGKEHIILFGGFHVST